MDDLEKQLGTSSRQHQAICIISSSYVNSNLSYSPETVKLGCDLCDLDLWPLTLTFCMDLTWVIDNNSMKISWWYNNGNIVKKVWQTDSRTDRQMENTICRAAWSQLTKGHLFYATSSFVQHFIPIDEFKLESQSGNAQSWSNSMIFRAMRPWNLTDDLAKQWGTSSMLLQTLCIISYKLVNSNLSYSPEMLNSGQNGRFF